MKIYYRIVPTPLPAGIFASGPDMGYAAAPYATQKSEDAEMEPLSWKTPGAVLSTPEEARAWAEGLMQPIRTTWGEAYEAIFTED